MLCITLMSLYCRYFGSGCLRAYAQWRSPVQVASRGMDVLTLAYVSPSVPSSDQIRLALGVQAPKTPAQEVLGRTDRLPTVVGLRNISSPSGDLPEDRREGC